VLSSFDFINLMIYSTDPTRYTSEPTWWTTNTGVPKNKLTWGIDFSTGLTPASAAQLNTSSKAYGGAGSTHNATRHTVAPGSGRDLKSRRNQGPPPSIEPRTHWM